MNRVSLTLREGEDTDAARIAEIFKHYILHSTATFKEQRNCTSKLARRITTA